jgi:hypothetical protein
MNIRAVSVPRDGSTAEENEDALAWREVDGGLVAAVSDGATESLYSRAFARCLADGFVADTPRDAGEMLRRLDDWIERWQGELPSGSLPWYVENRIDSGAHAALAGVSLRGRRLHATAVGDCCLLIAEQDSITSWPIESAELFSDRPVLLSTAGPQPQVQELHVDLPPDALVMLASDAVAKWLLTAGPSDVRAPDADLEALIIEARRSGTLSNDDATLLIIDHT